VYASEQLWKIIRVHIQILSQLGSLEEANHRKAGAAKLRFPTEFNRSVALAEDLEWTMDGLLVTPLSFVSLA